jgi:ADP-heptose:LPS heptosyltransferase
LKPSSFSSILPNLPPGAEILIIRLRSLGDVVMLTPALAALHAWRPDLKLSVLVQPPFDAVLEGNPAVSEILLYPGFLAAARELRRRKFPVTFNQHGGPTSAFLTIHAGSPHRVCWERCQFGFFYNVRVPDPAETESNKQLHTIEHRLQQFYCTGLPEGPILRAQVFPQPDAMESVSRKLREYDVDPRTPYLVLHPGAAYFTKRWSLAEFAESAKQLKKTYGLFPIVILGPGDRSISDEVQLNLGSVAPIFDSLTLRELIALIAGAQLFLGNDSGPAHLATAAGRPVVVIFGSSDSATWRPWQVPHRVVQNEFACNPCRGDRCYAFAEPQCILSIAPEQVRDACDSLLAETKVNRD